MTSDQSRESPNAYSTTNGGPAPADSGTPWGWMLGLVAAAAIFLLTVVVLMYQLVYIDRIYLGVSTSDGRSLAGLTLEEARAALLQGFQAQPRPAVVLRYRDREWQAIPQSLGLQAELDRAAIAAYRVGRTGSVPQRLAAQLDTLRHGYTIDPLAVNLSDQAVEAYAATLAREIDRPAVDARLVMGADLKPEVRPSQVGRRLEVAEASKMLGQALLARSGGPIDLLVQEIPPVEAEADLEPYRALGARMLSAPLTIKHEGRTWTLERADIAAMVVLGQTTAGGKRLTTVELEEAKLKSLVERLAQEVDRKPRKPRLEIAGGQIRVLSDGEPGHKVDVPAGIAAVKAGLTGDRREVALPVAAVTPPGMGQDRTAIKELVFEATTVYAGGSAERRHNIELAAKKLHGVVVGPDEVFSLNEEMGPMTLAAGFKWGWAISQQEGKAVTVPSVAGGICQVSTTLFQAVFWAGYQIEERSWHLYWIERYGRPPTGLKGLDATVDQIYDDKGNLQYAVDFKFRNTTPYPILIQTRTDGNNLTFALYSTKPGWEVKVDPPKIEDVVKADPTVVREEDPTMPPGQEIWVESAMDGFKSTIVRTVLEKGKEPRVLNLRSTYRPAQNVVRVGVAKPSATPGPAVSPTPNPVVSGQRPGEGGR